MEEVVFEKSMNCLNGVLRRFQQYLSHYHGNSSHYSCLSWVSPVLGRDSETSCARTFPRKTERIQCGSNPGPLDYESNTASTTEPRRTLEESMKRWGGGGGNGETDVYRLFLLFPRCFLKISYSRLLKCENCLVEGKYINL